MIVNVEYRCPECEKVFNCPANLASHRRWHKPKDGSTSKRRQIQNGLQNDLREPQSTSEEEEEEGEAEGGDLGCEECGRRFRKMSSLRKHLLTHEVARLRDIPGSSNNNNASPNSKSYSIAELLSPRKRELPSPPDLLVAPGNILSHLGHHLHHQRPPPPLISIANALSKSAV